MANLDDLRAQLLKAQGNANAKVRRLQSQGIEITGSSADVRVPRERIERYNRAQLLSQLAKVNTFNSRQTKFVAGREGAPISKLTYGVFEITQRANNARAKRHLDRVADTMMPNGNTIGFRMGMIVPRKKGTLGGDYRPVMEQHLKASNLTGEKSAKRLTRHMQAGLSQSKLNRAVDKQHAAAIEAMKRWGNPELVDRVKKLTRHQFNVLFNYTAAGRDIFAKYLEELLAAKGKKSIVSADESISDVIEWVSFAEGLPERA